MNLECAAIVSLVILAVNLVMKYVKYLIKKQINARNAVKENAVLG